MMMDSKNVWSAAAVSFLLVLPFTLLESFFRPTAEQSITDSMLLFGILWLFAFAFVAVLLGLIAAVRSGSGVLRNPLAFSFAVLFLIAVGSLWTAVATDQLPCFLGIPNCD